jgi:hypothetical protein
VTNAHERCPCGVPNDIGSWLIAAGTRWHAGCYEAALRFARQHPGYWKAGASTAAARATCSCCDRDVMLRQDGCLTAHRPWPQARGWCEGSYRTPLAAAYLEGAARPDGRGPAAAGLSARALATSS